MDVDEQAVAFACEQFPTAKHLCLVPGLGHPLVNKLRGRGFRVCWLRDSSEGKAGAQLLEGIKCATVEGSIGKENLNRLIEILENAANALRKSEGHPGWAAFNTLRAAIALMTALPVDVAYYDAAAIERFGVPTSRELLSTLVGFEKELGARYPSLAADVEEAGSILAQCTSNPDPINQRKTQLLKSVESAIADSGGLFVVVRNRTTRTAVEAFLSATLDTDLADLTSLGIRVEARSALRPETLLNDIPLLWTGYGGVQDLDTLFGLGSRRVTIMVNELERQLLARDIRSWANRGVAAQQGTETLGVSFQGKRQLLENLNRFAAEVSGSMQPILSTAGSADIGRLYEDLILKQEGLTTAGVDARTNVLRPAIAVLFESGSTSFFPEHGTVTVIRQNQTEPSEILVDDLQAGDRVVFIDREIGKTIYELMQEQLTQSPLVGATAHIVSVWHRAIAGAFARSGLSVDQLHKELQRRGSLIKTTQTVRYWLRGAVIGPLDSNNIDRLAAILSLVQRDPTVLDQIKDSVRGLRNVYRQFAKIVYRTILAGGTGKALSDSEQRLLEEHGISLFDLRSAISTDTVKSIGSRVELRPAALIGRDTNV